MSRGGFGRRFPHGRGRLRYRCPLRDRCLGLVESRGAGLSQIYRAGPQKAVADVDEDGRPDDYLTAKIDAVEALSTLLTRLGA
jgi:methylmalonyl-CoA mutase